MLPNPRDILRDYYAKFGGESDLISSASSFFASSTCDSSICRRCTNARMISTLTATARSLEGRSIASPRPVR